MSEWIKHPGLYRLFELGHVVAADGIREYMFESAGSDTSGAALISVYSRIPALEPSVIADLDEILGRGRFDFCDDDEDERRPIAGRVKVPKGQRPPREF
jgi:hypothetical protein